MYRLREGMPALKSGEDVKEVFLHATAPDMLEILVG